jgi:CDP-diglyceride synthetase
MKGLGGLMDLADSVLPATPILYLWARFFLVAPGSI